MGLPKNTLRFLPLMLCVGGAMDTGPGHFARKEYCIVFEDEVGFS